MKNNFLIKNKASRKKASFIKTISLFCLTLLCFSFVFFGFNNKLVCEDITSADYVSSGMSGTYLYSSSIDYSISAYGSDSFQIVYPSEWFSDSEHLYTVQAN